MSSTSSSALLHRDRAVFSEGRRKALRNNQHPQNTRSGGVKWESKRRTQPMANHASGSRPGPIILGAPLPHHHSDETQAVARASRLLSSKGGQP